MLACAAPTPGPMTGSGTSGDEGLDCLGGYPAGVGLHLGHAGAGCDRPGNLLGDAGGTSKERRVRGA